jgi:orotate phosphoribosyltransferase
MAVPQSELVEALREAGVLRHGLFTLRSGAKSPVYVDLRQIPSVPSAMDVVTSALAAVTRVLGAEAIAGAETAGIPLAAVVAHKTRLPMLYVRKEPKGYGTSSQIEGLVRTGQRAVLVDDLITDGGSKFVFLDALASAGVRAEDVLVILDREQGGRATLQDRGVRLHALLTLRELLAELLRLGALEPAHHAEILAYLDDPAGWEASLKI